MAINNIEEDMGNKKIISYVQIVLLFVAMFAVSYFMSESNEFFGGGQVVGSLLRLAGGPGANSLGEDGQAIGSFLENYKDIVSGSMMPVVSASEAGCCETAPNGVDCVTGLTEETCAGQFAVGVACENYAFCQRGCCYDESVGEFNPNVLQKNCPSNKDWVADPFCNLPEAQQGCCVLGDVSLYGTYGQCQTAAQVYALGDSSAIDWRSDTNELACSLLSSIEEHGACVYSGNNCKFTTNTECAGMNGEFSANYLCTAESLNTTCERTEETVCVEGRDQVFFVDSCGNLANVYDASRVVDSNYWERVVALDSVCNAGNPGASSDSVSCGNCFRTENICGSALEDGFNPMYGDSYCRTTSCEYNGVEYSNGESWCEYESKIGEGRDIPGSSHYQVSCVQGEAAVSPCAEYRNEICIQTVYEVEGQNINIGSCQKNTARNCVTFNTQEPEEMVRLCNDEPYCEMKEFRAADGSFDFDYCAPEYPAGFSFDERYQETAAQTCALATRTATYVEVQETWGGCSCEDNCNALDPEFVDEMHDFCKSLGDCGFDVNVVGESSENYDCRGGAGEISGELRSLILNGASPDGSFVPYDERMEKYLGAAGLLGKNGTLGASGVDGGMDMIGGPLGAAGIGVAVLLVYAAGWAISVSASAVTLGSYGVAVVGNPSGFVISGGAFAGAAVGAVVGAYVGGYLAEMNGASPGWGMVAVVAGAAAGALAGAAAMSSYLVGCWADPTGVLCVIIVILIIIMIIASYIGSTCKIESVEFTCEPWQPPVGASDCTKCGENGLPCNEYKCQSLGAGCELVNRGTLDEACAGAEDNGDYPRVEMNENHALSAGIDYGRTLTGTTMRSSDGSCLPAYSAVPISISTNELSQCKFDTREFMAFDDMGYSLGSNAYTYDHNYVFSLPDPSHGQSQGYDVNGNIMLYIKCRDRFGHETPTYYTVDICVKEGEDFTAPRILRTIPSSDSYVSFDDTEFNAQIITNELATCKWDSDEFKPYAEMANEFECLDTLTTPSSSQGYVCAGNLPVTNVSNYYIKCQDQPWLVGTANESSRNTMMQSHIYSVKKPSSKISIFETSPDRDIVVTTAQASVTLDVTTAGGAQYHACEYSFSGYDSMIPFFETQFNTKHTQLFNLNAGQKKIYVECSDETGDFARGEANFEIIQETTAPQVTRAWQVGSSLHITTDEEAVCKYTEDQGTFVWSGAVALGGDGFEHRIEAVRGATYYVKCQDMLGNYPASGYSIILSAS